MNSPMGEHELKAWQELKQVLDLCPAEDLTVLFNGTEDEREQLAEKLGVSPESFWLVEICIFGPRE